MGIGELEVRANLDRPKLASSLARELNVARTVIYHQFGDANGVVASVGSRVMGQLFDEVARLADSTLQPSERIRTCVRTETRLLAMTSVPVEAILVSPALRSPAHAGSWDSLGELQDILVGWIISLTGFTREQAHTRLAVAIVASFVFILSFDFFANWDLEDISYTGIAIPGGFLRNLFLDGFHPVLPWLAFYLFGMWLGRTDLRDPAAVHRSWRRNGRARDHGIDLARGAASKGGV